MIRALFVYKYLTIGGVEAVLRARLDGLPAFEVDGQAWFLRDGAGRSFFRGVEERVHVGGVFDLQRFVEAWAPDLVTLIDTEEAFPVLGQTGGGSQLVVEVHTPYRENLVYLRWLERVRVAAFLTPSAYQAQIVESRIHQIAPIHVVPNPIRSIFTVPIRAFTPFPPAPIVAWVGRLDALKNWVGFLNIAADLVQQEPKVEFWLIGESPGRSAEQELVHQARKRGLLSRLSWYASLPNDRMPRLFDAVRESGGVLVSTSLEESFGMVVAEAMARACAVAVPARSAFVDFVEPERHGILYKPGSPEDAARGIARLLKAHGFRKECGQRGRESILKVHAPEAALPLFARRLHEIARVEGIPATPRVG